MNKNYKSALGRTIDMDSLRLANEETIAVGNMRVNARGDELGPGGEIVRTRNEVMNEYYKLNTPMVNRSPRPVVDETAVTKPIEDTQNQSTLRGDLANFVVKNNQKNLQDPEGEE